MVSTRMNPTLRNAIALVAFSFASPAVAETKPETTSSVSDRDRIKAERRTMDDRMKKEPMSRPWDGLNLLNPKADVALPPENVLPSIK